MSIPGALTREQVAEQLCRKSGEWSVGVKPWTALSESQKEFYRVMADWVLTTITQQAQELEQWKHRVEVRGGFIEIDDCRAKAVLYDAVAHELGHLNGVLGANKVLIERLAAMTKERDNLAVLAKNRREELDRIVQEQHHTYTVEIPDLRQQLAAMTTRFTETAKSFDEAIKREALALQQLAAMTREKNDEFERWQEAHDLQCRAEEQLATSQARVDDLTKEGGEFHSLQVSNDQLQARCRELEKEIGSPNETGTYAWDRKERIRMKRVIEDFCIAEGKLQATLAAREARIQELEGQP